MMCNEINNDLTVLYTDITEVNPKESLDKILNIPFHNYKFVYDKISDRKLIGILPTNAHKYFPESLEIIKNYVLPSYNKTNKGISNIEIKNFPLVDKNVLFMHGLIGLQQLIHSYYDLNDTIHELLFMKDDINHIILNFESHLNIEINNEILSLKQKEIKENELLKANLHYEQMKTDQDELIIQNEIKKEKLLLEYEEILTKERLEFQENLTKTNMLFSLSIEKELIEQQENLRYQYNNQLNVKRNELNIQFENFKLQNDYNKFQYEINLKLQKERENEDIRIRKMEIKAKLETNRILETVKLIFTQFITIIKTFLLYPKQLFYIFCLILLLYVVVVILQQCIQLYKTILYNYFGKPLLIRETSFNVLHYIPVIKYIVMFSSARPSQSAIENESLKSSSSLSNESMKKYCLHPSVIAMIEEEFSQVILSDDDKHRIIQLAITTFNTKYTQAPYRHVLLHGPPGTGKTMIGK
jgi:ATPase family AAA domain-containing protein 3A/B